MDFFGKSMDLSIFSPIPLPNEAENTKQFIEYSYEKFKDFIR